MSAALIGDNDITLIEDGMSNYTPHPYTKKISWFNRLQNGGFCEGTYGYNKNTKKIILTGLAPLPYEDPRVEYIHPQKLWQASSREKQNYLLQCFYCQPEDILAFEGKEIIIFTQPLSEDGLISEKEKIRIYQNIIPQYPPEKTIIKVHPRENSQLYKTYFPGVALFEKKIPMELLSLLGAKFKRAATVYSTAVCNFNYPLQIDWYGTEISESLQKTVGAFPQPFKVANLPSKKIESIQFISSPIGNLF